MVDRIVEFDISNQSGEIGKKPMLITRKDKSKNSKKELLDKIMDSVKRNKQIIKVDQNEQA